MAFSTPLPLLDMHQGLNGSDIVFWASFLGSAQFMLCYQGNNFSLHVAAPGFDAVQHIPLHLCICISPRL